MDFDFVECEPESADLSTRFEEIEVIDLALRKGKGKPDHSSKIHPGLDRKPGVSNWVDKVGGLPSYIERIAKHIHSDSGLTISHAIAAAVERVKVLAAKGNAQAIKALAEWEAKKKASGGKKGKGKNLSATGDAVQVIDLAILRRAKLGTYSTYGGSASAKTTGVRGSAFDEAKHQRTQNGQFGRKLNPSDLIAARRKVEGNITNLAVGQTYELPDKLGWVKRTAGGYFVQGPAGFSASVRTLSEAVQAAAAIIAGKARGSV